MYNAHFSRNLKFKKFQNKKLIFILQHLVYDFYFDAINSTSIFKLLEDFVDNQIKAGKAKFDAAWKQ